MLEACVRTMMNGQRMQGKRLGSTCQRELVLFHSIL